MTHAELMSSGALSTELALLRKVPMVTSHINNDADWLVDEAPHRLIDLSKTVHVH